MNSDGFTKGRLQLPTKTVAIMFREIDEYNIEYYYLFDVGRHLMKANKNILVKL